jgi:hypothetical protein
LPGPALLSKIDAPWARYEIACSNSLLIVSFFAFERELFISPGHLKNLAYPCIVHAFIGELSDPPNLFKLLV